MSTHFLIPRQIQIGQFIFVVVWSDHYLDFSLLMGQLSSLNPTLF